MEPSDLCLKAREILATPSHKGFEIIVEQLSMRQETNEYQTAFALFDFCAKNFSNCFTLKLLKVYQCSSNSFIRLRSIYLLSITLAEFKTQNIKLSRIALNEIKPHVIACLLRQETKESEIRILRSIVSFLVYDVVVCNNDRWSELSDCILSLVDKEPLKAFHVFVDLPRVYKTFMDKFMQLLVEKARTVLLNPEQSGVEDWSLALETIVKLGIQLLDTEKRYDLIRILLDNVLQKSVKELVEKGMEQFLVRGLEHLERFVSRDKVMYNYSKEQCIFVKTCMFKIKDFGTQTKEIVKKINQLVKVNEPRKNIIVPQKKKDDDDKEYFRKCNEHLKTLPTVEILRIFESNVLDVDLREMAIRRLEVVLSNHISKKVLIDKSMFRELQPLLISCLKKQGISESMFKVLGEVVNHVAFEMFVHQEQKWNDLRDYIASRSKIDFQRAVYIFQCLTMALIDNDFVNPVMENLLPEIRTRLNPPRELLVDNSCWVLAFTGAFCSTIHLLKIPSHAESVKEIAIKMIDSVKELVERGMEVGLVSRAFRDFESIVKKQLEWYKTIEYKFVKGLLWRLYEIKGMKGESKLVLWRINVIVERGVKEEFKVFPKGEFEWLNQPEA